MQVHNPVLDALDRVMAWDLPDEACPWAVSSQAALMAGIGPEQVEDVDLG